MASIASDFMLLLVTINPFAVVPVFLAVTRGMTAQDRRRIAMRATVIATVILIFLLAFGQLFLEKVGVTLPALRIAGALVLLILGIRMVFGEVPGSQPVKDEEPGDIAVFPLAMPMLAGGGSIAAIVAMTDHHINSLVDQAVTAIVLLAVMAIIYAVLRSAEKIQSAIGATGTNVMSRIMGLVLTALAVQTFFSVFQPLLPAAIYP
ncbi:MarC family protein [Aestuariivirga sp.]|uniref:MarC family protein n=1 Tax=Aestuariivirga sp. TaxID=2650926 RepID=UPI003BAA9891